MATKLLGSKAYKDWNRVRASENYRSFLQAYLEEASLSLSSLARAAGFGRGFPGDIISGKRRVTAKSYYAFEKALKLPPSGKKLFRYLVAREEPGVFPELEPLTIARNIDTLRSKAWTSARRELRESEAPNIKRVFANPKSVLVYTAAGRPGRGATLDEISNRTSLSKNGLMPILKSLESAGLVTHLKSDDCYEPRDLHLFVKAGSQSELILQAFRSACLAAAERAPKALDSEDEFFFTSTFCVSEGQLPELKKALRETILRFVDEAIHSEGDRIVQLTTALHSN